MRLDEYMVKHCLAASRERAKEMIKSGLVTVNGKTAPKPAFNVNGDENIEASGSLKYVSRGGLKLEKALSVFGISTKGKKCVDLGASTGGFTDCMLQNGALLVYALDSGHGQLDKKLLSDSRVISAEGFNVRYLTPDDIDGKADFISCDLSFISLGLIIPVIAAILREDGEGVILIKPQFECGRENIGKNGIVRSPEVHRAVLEKVFSQLADAGLILCGCTYSPVQGGSGNIEYLAHIAYGQKESGKVCDPRLIVDEAFSHYRKER